MATFTQQVDSGEDRVEQWKRTFTQLSILFDDVNGFKEFMLIIAANLLRDNKYGMIARVSVGALISTIDAATDIYVVVTYLQSAHLYTQAYTLITMISINMSIQLLVAYGQNLQKNWAVKVYEMVLCLMFLRPVVDAYRVR